MKNRKGGDHMDRPWKAFERQIAKLMGTKRALNHLAGGGDKSDIEHPIYSVDCKLRKNARKHHKIPVLVYRKPKERLTYCVIELDTFISLAKGAGWLNQDAANGSESHTEQAAG